MPSGEKITLMTQFVCPFSSSRGVPVRASQTFTALSTAGDLRVSPLPVTILRAVGEKLTLVTPSRVPLSSSQWRAGARVPDLRRPVRTAGDDPGAVGGELHARDHVRVPLQFESIDAASAHAVSQTLAVLSALPVTIRAVGGETHTLTQLVCPFSCEQCLARVLRVPDPRRLVLTAGDDLRAVGGKTHAPDRSRVPLEFEQRRACCASQTFAVLSSLPVTIRVPSGLKLTLQLTALVCPLSSSSGCRSCASQTFAVLSSLPVTMRVPSGLKDARDLSPCVP